MDWTVESVRGTVIGPVETRKRYKFYTQDGKPITYDWHFAHTDAEAVQWFKENYPEHYARGVEMRAWD
jgi:hypothetical protein